MSKLRLYTFINFYLSPIQQGIQSGHIMDELTERYIIYPATDMELEEGIYKSELLKEKMVRDFIVNHKTYIVCNGGNAKSLIEFHEFLFSVENPYPWASFNEDEDSLNCAMTGVGIILPEEIYDMKWDVNAGAYSYEKDGVVTFLYEEEGYKFELVKRIKSARLA